MKRNVLEDFSEYELDRTSSFTEQLQVFWDKYGIPIIIVGAFTAMNFFITWNALQWMQRADQQSKQNFEIGILKERIDNLIKLQEKQCNP